jgi:hypothetical protein
VKRTLPTTVISILVLSLTAGLARGEVKVVAQAVNQSVYKGDAVELYVIIDGDNSPGEVDVSPWKDFNPTYMRGQNTSQSSTFIAANGKMTTRESRQYVMVYALAPKQVGRIEIPSVTVKVAGQEYRTNPVSVTVTEPTESDKMRLEMELSDEKCYVGQPVLLTVKWYLYNDLGDYRLLVPALQSDDFDIEDADASEQPTGAQVQIVVGGQQVLGTQRTVVKDGANGALVSFVKLLIPKRPGELAIEPASAAANLVVGTRRSNDPFDMPGVQPQYKRFVAASEARKLTVLPLPTEGRPKEFYGLIGKYATVAEARPTRVSVGEPITLTVRVTGRYLKPVTTPDFASVPGFTESFRVPKEQALPKVSADGKEFTQTIRATSDQVKEIPAIPLVYFDSATGQYVTVASQPIPLTVEKTNVLTGTDVEGTRDMGLSGRAVEAAKMGISANYNGSDALTNEAFSLISAIMSPAYAAIWGLPLVGLMVSAIAKAASSTSPEKQAARRRKGALGRASATLKRTGGQDRYEVVAAALKQYLGDRFDRVAGSLTADDCRQIVVDATGDAGLAQRYKAMVERCEAGRYAGMGIGELPPENELIATMRQVERGAAG